VDHDPDHDPELVAAQGQRERGRAQTGDERAGKVAQKGLQEEAQTDQGLRPVVAE
jgi:hypothetical protein